MLLSLSSFIVFKGYMWLCKNLKEKKGSKRWTSVPIMKTMGAPF